MSRPIPKFLVQRFLVDRRISFDGIVAFNFGQALGD
jgi:hypothetical protein